MISKIQSVNVSGNQRINFTSNKVNTSQKPISYNPNFTPLPLGNIYGARINFGARRKKTHQTHSPAQILYAHAAKNHKIKTDRWTLEHIYHGVNHPEKRWVAGVEPKELLNRNLSDAINSIMTLQYGENIPDRKSVV